MTILSRGETPSVEEMADGTAATSAIPEKFGSTQTSGLTATVPQDTGEKGSVEISFPLTD